MQARIEEKWVSRVVIEMTIEDARNLHNQAYAAATHPLAAAPYHAENVAVLQRFADALTAAGVQLPVGQKGVG